jgi:hypothetical protein
MENLIEHKVKKIGRPQKVKPENADELKKAYFNAYYKKHKEEIQQKYKERRIKRMDETKYCAICDVNYLAKNYYYHNNTQAHKLNLDEFVKKESKWVSTLINENAKPNPEAKQIKEEQMKDEINNQKDDEVVHTLVMTPIYSEERKTAYGINALEQMKPATGGKMYGTCEQCKKCLFRDISGPNNIFGVHYVDCLEHKGCEEYTLH